MKTFIALLALAATVSAGTWSIVAENVATAATGIWFSNSKVGYLPADENGAGAEVLRSEDGGKTFTPVPHKGGFLFLSVAGYMNSDKEVIVVSGAFGEEFSPDGGKSFNQSIGGGQSQCVAVVGDHANPDGIGIAGDMGFLGSGPDGVAVSYDDGATFTSYAAGLWTDSRYAAFVDKNNWFVTAGTWAGEGPSDDDKSNDDPFDDNNFDDTPSTLGVDITQRFSVRLKGNKLRPVLHEPGKRPQTNYTCQVTKTTDGGKTFTTVFAQNGTFYPNDIAALSEQDVCFVAETDSGAAAGSYIWCTWDGGASWNNTLYNAGPEESLMGIATTGTAGEYWASGGTYGSLSAKFFHSTDSGRTWTLVATIPNQVSTFIDCPSSSACFATTVDIFQQSSVAAYA